MCRAPCSASQLLSTTGAIVAMSNPAPAGGGAFCSMIGTNAAGTSVIDTGAALAKVSRCDSCHDAVRVLIGPPYQAIALRYVYGIGGQTDVPFDRLIKIDAQTGGRVSRLPPRRWRSRTQPSTPPRSRAPAW